MKQQIIINPAGDISSIEAKRGKGLDIRQLGGQAEIVRSSIIEFIAALQMNVIFLLNYEPLTEAFPALAVDVIQSNDANCLGLLVTGGVAQMAMDIDRGSMWAPSGSEYAGAAMFKDYEDAVAYEVKLIQALREKFGPGIV